MAKLPTPNQSVETLPHSTYKTQVLLLTQLRNQKTEYYDISAINALLISATTTFLENFMSSILHELCGKCFDITDNNPLRYSMIMAFKSEINRSSFSNYRNLMKSLTDKGFDKFSNPESWKSVSMLFALRNQLMHGKSIKVRYYRSEDSTIQSGAIENMEDIQKYLHEKRLLPESYLISPSDVLSNKVLYHFMRNSLDFVIQCHANVISEFKTQPIFMLKYSLEDLDKILNQIKDH